MRQILLFIFISLACSLSAEQFKITGKVVDATDNDQQLIGATVTVEGTHRVVNTDFDGNFSIEVEKGDTLKFSFVRYLSREVEVLNDSSLVIELDYDPEAFYDEIPIITYSGCKRAHI